MKDLTCTRCHDRPATILGVPATVQVFEHAVQSGNTYSFPIEPDTWMRLCDVCASRATDAHEIIATFDLSTWRHPLRRDGRAV